ncbi:MAG: hypothetical protein ACTSQJ_04290 [Promethearchaeota archaeon]
MQEKLTPEELAQKSLELLENAEKLEEERNFAKAIELYTRAAENLKKSGYLMHRIEDIYTRITELNNYIQQEKIYQQAASQAQIEQLQDQAFAILDGAKKLEHDGHFEDAIQQYMSAISLLAQAGWSEMQLDNIKSKISVLAQNIERQKLIQQQKQFAYSQQQAQIETSSQPQILSPSTQAVIDPKAEALRAYVAKKKQEEEMQNQAFSHIDNAKMFEKEKKFDEAIANYQKAIEILNTLGWTQQTQNLRVIVDKLHRDKIHYEETQIQKQKEISYAQTSQPTLEIISQATPELREKKLMEFEAKKKKEEEIQNKAFNLIDIGKRLERERKYEEAISKFEESIQLLKSIEWDSYIQPIINFINDIKVKMQKEAQADQIKRKRQEELENLQKTLKIKQKEQFIQTSQEMEIKRKEFEKKRIEEIEKEKQFFAILDKADKILQEGNFNDAIKEYNNALDILRALGSGWESYIPSIEMTISTIKQKNQEQAQKDEELKRREEKRRLEEQQFQAQIAEQLNKERERLLQKKIEFREREKELKYLEQRKEQAFKFLDTAQNYIKQGELDKAIYAYQNAGNIFAEIQWVDELPLIENSIKALEDKIYQQKLLKQKQMEEEIERRKREKEFQKQIARQLHSEREKLRQKEIALREQEKEIEYRERMKEETFKLLEEAQEYVKSGEFDKAINIYRDAAFIFAEIQWHDQIDFIENAIIEIENKKKEAELRKQMELQLKLEREKSAKEFQKQIAKEMSYHREKLKQKEVILREREKEVKYREQKKKEAFELLDDAQELLAQGKFDDALELYYNVANIFAEIQWTEEIPLIQDAIKEIENRKKEKEFWKKKTMQEVIQRQTMHEAFTEQIKHQRELEKAKLLQKQKEFEKEKELNAQLIAKQKEAFSLIDE